MSNPSCSIITFSSSSTSITRLINHVKSLSSPSSSTPSELRDNALQVPGITPWTIKNKYYSADVHFDARLTETWDGELPQGVPAVILVWEQGQIFRDNVVRIGRAIKAQEPEVALGVRLSALPAESSSSPDVMPTSSRSSPPAEEAQEDEDDLDEFLSMHGFEFIDVDTTEISKQRWGISEDGIPGLPRVLDALSTIMWPSMVRASSSTSKSSTATGRTRELLDWARDQEHEATTKDLLSELEDPSLGPSAGPGLKTRMQHEMEELERWLDDDLTNAAPVISVTGPGSESSDRQINKPEKDPWALAAASPRVQPSEGKESFGFDDDFTVFVSAPPPDVISRESSSSTAEPSNETDVDKLDVHAYTALGSDYGGQSDDGRDSDAEEEGDGDGLPTAAEIAATSRRIFGPPSMTEAPAAKTGPPRRPFSTSSSQAATRGTQTPEGEDLFQTADDDGDGDGDFEAFDLNKVLSALEGMKAEIASLDDEQARRHAAARVALGLVYGLEREPESQPTQ